jgi:imidazolonepropionase-like amidohydrolase
MDVVIVGDRIADIGKAGRLRVPAGARMIDGRGKFLIPGLWDMHVHSLFEGRTELFFPAFVANGVTGVREMSSELSFEEIARVRRRTESGELLGPRFGAVSGRILEGPVGELGPGMVGVASPEEGRRLVGSFKEQGADFIKVYNQLSRETYFAIVDECRKRRIPFAGHVPLLVTAGEASDAGQKSVEHLTRVLLSCSSREAEIRRGLVVPGPTVSAGNRAGFMAEGEAADSYDAAKAARLFARFRKNGTWQCPTLVQLRKLASTDDPAFTNDDRSRYVPRAVRADWEERRKRLAGILPFAKRFYPKDLEVVRAMREAGVGLLAGTDAGWGNPYTYPGFSLHDELELLVLAGLTPLEALQTATLNPARYLGRERELGTIERGKLADLVLLDANPLDDIRNTRRIAAVVVGGRYLPAPELRKLLAEVEAAAGAR